MTLQDEIDRLFLEISDNQDRVNDLFDKNVKKIKNLLKGKMNSEQTTIFLNWSNKIVPQVRDSYMSPIGGFYLESDFQVPILNVAFDIENKND